MYCKEKTEFFGKENIPSRRVCPMGWHMRRPETERVPVGPGTQSPLGVLAVALSPGTVVHPLLNFILVPADATRP